MTHMGEEISMYQRAGELVMLLNNWHATPGQGLAELMVELAQIMAVNNFWGQVKQRVATFPFWKPTTHLWVALHRKRKMFIGCQ